jgi:hypothetical protein
MAPGAPFTVILNSADTVLAVDPVSARDSNLKGVRSLGEGRTFGLSTPLVLKLSGLASDQSTSAVTDNHIRFREEVVKLAFDHYVILEAALPSVLKLPVDWPATKVQALSRIPFPRKSRHT